MCGVCGRRAKTQQCIYKYICMKNIASNETNDDIVRWATHTMADWQKRVEYIYYTVSESMRRASTALATALDNIIVRVKCINGRVRLCVCVWCFGDLAARVWATSKRRAQNCQLHSTAPHQVDCRIVMYRFVCSMRSIVSTRRQHANYHFAVVCYAYTFLHSLFFFVAFGFLRSHAFGNNQRTETCRWLNHYVGAAIVCEMVDFALVHLVCCSRVDFLLCNMETCGVLGGNAFCHMYAHSKCGSQIFDVVRPERGR